MEICEEVHTRMWIDLSVKKYRAAIQCLISLECVNW